uniref:Uncharacterized protein n=1 Tax=Panagrolaimus davidi TaxID=227884 RepID=A0A914QAS5_9BILA
MFDVSPHDSPNRKRPGRPSRDNGKKPRHAPIAASAFRSAIQQTVPPESSSDTPTSSQLHDREPSPSIFD